MVPTFRFTIQLTIVFHRSNDFGTFWYPLNLRVAREEG